MNTFPIIDMIALYSAEKQHSTAWGASNTYHIQRIRSCHSRTEGGVRKSFYSVETRKGNIFDLTYNEEELEWITSGGKRIKNLLARIHRHKHMYSRAHRIEPLRFEIDENKTSPQTGLSLTSRVEPYRFQTGKIPSSQIINIRTRHLENVMITKHLHYIVRTDQNRFFNLVFIQDQHDWRLLQEVDEQLFFS